MYRKYIKRVLDVSISASAIFVLTPVYIVLYFIVWKKMGRPVFFAQERPGKNGKIFKMYKFRTMTDDRDKDGNLLPDEKRLNKFGKLLRSTSLDELPELFNILKGDMSLVGPRPLLVSYLPLYNKKQRHRHDVRPGLTGLAQVNGRNSISWEERFDFDVQYVRELSFLLDVKIILMTVWKVISRDGISEEGSATMTAFTGTK